MKENNPEQKIIKREVIIDQSDPRMVEFRESYGEFKLGCKRKTVRLEITEYEPTSEGFKMITELGYYEGEPPLGYREFFRKLFQGAIDRSTEEEKQRNFSE